jgi:threonine-phosphate decarboxylase
MIEGHGNALHLYKGKIRADFSTNVVPVGVHPRLEEHLRHSLGLLSHYPDPAAGELQEAIARFHHLHAGQVQVFNGSTEAFYLLAQHFRRGRSLVVAPGFTEYADACRIHEHTVEYAKVEALLTRQQDSEPVQMVWLANPNNPDGFIPGSGFIENLCRQYPHAAIVVDEAYGELCQDHKSALALLSSYHNLVVVKSFTKLFALPGLRLGYLCGHASVINALAALRMPWSVNALAIAAGMFILENYATILPPVEPLWEGSLYLQREIGKLPLFTVLPSRCNYFLAHTARSTAARLKEYLISHHEFLIRDAANFVGLGAGHFRIAARHHHENVALVEAIHQWTQTQTP